MSSIPENKGYNGMKEAHEQQMAYMDQVAKENPKAVLGWISGELLSGKFLILPEAIYDDCIKLCRENGMDEDAIKNIHKSTYLPAYSKPK